MRAVCLILATGVAVGPVGAAAQEGRERPETTHDEAVLIVRAPTNQEAWRSAMLSQLSSRGVPVRPPAEPPAAIDERPALTRAERAYQGLQPERALAELESLLRRLESTGGAGLDQPDIIRAHLIGALCTQVQGNLDLSFEFIDQVIRIDPTFTPPASDYPPTLREIHRQRFDAAEATLTAVVPTGLPQGARTYLDGTEVTMPADVRSGPHLLRAEAPGHIGRGVRFVATGDQIRLNLALERDAEAVFRSASSLPVQPDAVVRRMARALGVGIMELQVTLREGGASAVLASHDEHRRVRWSGDGGAQPAFVAAFLADRWTGSPALLSTNRQPDPEAAPTWPWIVGGAVAAVGGVVLTVVIVALASSQDGFETIWTRNE